MTEDLFKICEEQSLTIEKLQSIIDKDFYIRDIDENTPLHFLCGNKSLTADMLRLVANKDFNIKNNKEDTPLYWLCMNTILTAEMLRLVIDKNFSVKDNNNLTPLYHLCDQNKCEFDELIKYIIFPFKLKKCGEFDLHEFPEWAAIRDEQNGINDRNFKYLEESAKKSAEILLFVLVRF